MALEGNQKRLSCRPDTWGELASGRWGGGGRCCPSVSVSQTVLTGLEKLEGGAELCLELIRWKVLVVSAKAKSRSCEGKNVYPGDSGGNENRGIGDCEY